MEHAPEEGRGWGFGVKGTGKGLGSREIGGGAAWPPATISELFRSVNRGCDDPTVGA